MIDLIAIPIIILIAIIIMFFSLRKKIVKKECNCSGESKKCCRNKNKS
ncbi:hypothetical protein [Brachyspira pilosicoli]